MFMASGRLDWDRDGFDWPNRAASRFLRAGGVAWHVQVMGPEAAPAVLLLHGTGAGSHSFRAVMPALAAQFRVVAPDLPGHAFTRAPRTALSLSGMSRALLDLCAALAVAPAVVAGHSAGAAIALQMALEGDRPPGRVIGFNAALKPIEGDHFFSPLAKMLFLNPVVPHAFASLSRYTAAADRLLERTGSRIDAAGRRCYGRLLASPEHVSGALGMMANWDLAPLRAGFARLPCAVTLVAALDDAMVPASVSREAAAAIAGCELVLAPSGGHLMHEAAPEHAAGLIAARMPANIGEAR